MVTDLPYWLALVRFHGFGPVRMQKLARRFPSMKHAFESNVTALLEAGIDPQLAHRFFQERIHLNPEQEIELLKEHKIDAITITDERYPPLLKTLYDPPSVLFVRGRLPNTEQKHVAVVGSRKPSSYGKNVTQRLVEPLASAGVVIVSGLAYGIDALAHQTTLDAGGITIAVLGSGIDQESIYPSANRALASHILANNGALISEFPIGTLPFKSNFPMRNRVIAGLCHGTLVIEATFQSGSLITARAALEAGRDVYAVPGPIHSPLSEGPNNLIKMGAFPVTEATDIYHVETKNTQIFIPSNDEERLVYTQLKTDTRHIDELIRNTGLDTMTVNRTLTRLEMKNAIRHNGGQYYSANG